MSPPTRTRPGANTPEFSVGEITGAVKRTLENAFERVRVRGEINGNYRGPHTSGHAYFSLREDRSSLDAVVWKGSYRQLKVKPEAGMEVIATGRISTFNSKYQLIVESLEPAGAGALMAMLEKRKAAFQAEGLFENERKRPLPRMPRTIGIVTSPTGAVIRDIAHRIADRFPVHLVVWPVRVQGDTCPPEVSAAIRGFNEGGPFPRPDVLIVARGGGSLEDLWGFNDEAVVRAVAASEIPVISAVGHETDWTLIDLVADRRAPTPTGAAEMAVPVRAELEAALAGLVARHANAITRTIDRRRERVAGLARALPNADAVLALPRRSLDEATGRLDRALSIVVSRAASRNDAVAARLSPRTVRRLIREKGTAYATLADRLSPVALRRRVREQQSDVVALGKDLRRNIRDVLAKRGQDLRFAEFGLDPRPLEGRLARLSARFDTVEGRLGDGFQRLTERRATRLAALDRLHETLGYKSVLARGYAVVRDEAGRPLDGLEHVAFGDLLTVEMRDGTIDTRAGQRGDGVEPAKKRKPRKTKASEAEQATLF